MKQLTLGSQVHGSRSLKRQNLEEAHLRGASHLFARASMLCYALGPWLVIAVVLILTLSLSGLMPQLVSPIGIIFLYVGPFLYLLMIFYLAQAGDLYEVPQFKRALKASAALALILVAVPLPVLVSALYGLIPQDSWLILLFLIVLVLVGILLAVSAQALQKGIRGLVTKICPENPPLEFRAAQTVSSYATALWIFVTLVLWFLSFSSDPTVAKLFSQQYANVWAIFFLPAAAIITVLYGRALGKLAHCTNTGTPREKRAPRKR